MAKRIGILGGISAESTAEYYRRLVLKYIERRGDDYIPEIIIYSLNFGRFTDLENGDDQDAYIEEIMGGIRPLQDVGADFIIMAANSPHAVYHQVEARTRAPMISIVQATVRKAAELGLRRLLLLGIKFTMGSDFYPRACRKEGIDLQAPAEEEQDEINAIIFDELTRGIITEKSREHLLEIIGRYPVDGVILGCTELPLILSPADSELVLLDTLDLHVEAALDYALAP